MIPRSLTMQRHALWLTTKLRAWSGLSGQVYFEQRVSEYRGMWEAVAAGMDARFTALAPDLWEIEAHGGRARIRNHELEFDDPVTLALAARKPLVHALLGDAGLAVPKHRVFTLGQLGIAKDFAAGHSQGCVIKPAGGYGGKGVTTHVRGPAEVRRAALRAAVHDDELLIEPMIPGESYRLLVLEGRVVDAVCRQGPRVTADGVSTVRALVLAERARRARGSNGRYELAADRDLLFTLAYQGLTLDSTPKRGRLVVLKSIDARGRQFANVRTVYTHRALDRLCGSVLRDAERAAAIIGSDFLGVDVITPDPAVPLAESGGVINEVNTTPALHHHYDAARERFPSIAPRILETLLRRDRERSQQRAATGVPRAQAAAASMTDDSAPRREPASVSA